MFDFNHTRAAKSKPPVEFLSRPVQRRILLLVVMVGGTLLLGKLVIESRFWEELFAPPRVSARSEDAVPPQPKYYNTAIRPQPAHTLPLDTFLAQAEVPAKVDPTAKFYPGVEPQLLGDVRDFTPFRPAENPAWFNLLHVLDESDAESLTKASTGKVGFVQLYEQMDVYRGELITVRGVVKRAFDVQAVKNDFGIEKYYQLWLFPEGGPISPIVIYALELPPEFPLSRTKGDAVANITENVTLTGFAFKNWVYGTEQRIESAPLLLAKSFLWHRPVVVEEQPVSFFWIGAVVVGTALFALLFTVYVVKSSNKIGAKTGPLLAHLSAGSTDEHPPSSAEVGQTLRVLAEQAETGEPFETPPATDTPLSDETSQ
jgi:hypothetical protein